MAASRAGKKLTGFAVLALAVSAGGFLRPTAGQDFGLPDEVTIAISLPAFAAGTEVPGPADADGARVRAVFPPPAPEPDPRLKEMEGQLKALRQELAAFRGQLAAQNPVFHETLDPSFVHDHLPNIELPKDFKRFSKEQDWRRGLMPGGVGFVF